MTGGTENSVEEPISTHQKRTLRSADYISDTEAFDFVDIQEDRCAQPVKTNPLKSDSIQHSCDTGIANVDRNEHLIFEYARHDAEILPKQKQSVMVPRMQKSDTDIIKCGYQEQQRLQRANTVEPRRKRLVHEIMESLPRHKLSGIVQIVMQAGAGQIVEGDLVFDLYSMDQKVIQELELFVQSSSQSTPDAANTSARPQRKSRRSQYTESSSESSSGSPHEYFGDYHTESTRLATSEIQRSRKSTSNRPPNIRVTNHRQESPFTEQQRSAIFSTNEILWVNRDSEASEDDEMALQRLPLEGSSLRLLLVSDLHLELSTIHRLAALLEEQEESIDLVLLSGDIANMADEDRSNADVQAATEGEVSFVISAVESICPRVLYVPGNHDPDSMLSLTNELPRLTPNSENIHGKVRRIAKNLVVFGFGGSTPAHADGTMVWTGYPYRTDQSLGPEFEKNCASQESSGENKILPTDQVILMTHTGPDLCDTALDPTRKVPIRAGCASLRYVIETALFQEKTLLNVHGHVHKGYGLSRVKLIPVTNPGSLKEGRYGLVTVDYSAISEKWEVRSVELHVLP